MNNKLAKFINEEIDRTADRLDVTSDGIREVILELFQQSPDRLASNLGSVEVDGNDQLTDESWEWFIQTVTQSINEDPEEWIKLVKDVKLRILTFKYFSRKELMEIDSVENFLRVNIKPYFAALQSHRDMKDFRSKFFLLPTDMLFGMVRYMFHLSKDLKDKIKVTNQDLRKNITTLTEMRFRMAERISQLSNGYQNIIDIKELKLLYDNGLLFEDNFINRGINEFVVKMISHKTAMDKLNDVLNSSGIKDMKRQAETSAAYMAHATDLKNEASVEFFTLNGAQIGRRFDNILQVVKDRSYDGYVVDKESRFKEPVNRIKDVVAPWESDGGATGVGGPGGAEGPGGGGASGGSGGSGGGSFGSSFSGGGFSDVLGGEFAEPGEEGEIPGVDGGEGEEKGGEEGGEVGVEDDGTPMPTDSDGLPTDFGSIEDNSDIPAEDLKVDDDK